MKTHLIALAAAAAAALVSQSALGAASIVTNPATSTYSKEGLALSGVEAVQLPSIRITFGNNLTYQDDILILIPGVTAYAPTLTAGLVVCSTAANAVGYVSVVPGGWKFRVTDVSGITVGAYCDFTGLAVTANSLSITSGRLIYEADRGLTSPTVIVDGPVTSDVAILVRSQFDITVPQKLNGIINVYAGRMAFFEGETVPPGSGASPPTQADTLKFSTFTSGNPLVPVWTGPTANVKEVHLTILGDFGWVDGADANTTCDASEFMSSVLGYYSTSVPAGVWTVGGASNCQQLVLGQNNTGSSVNEGYFYVPGNVVLASTDWMGNIEWAYELSTDSTIKGKTSLAWDPGAWTMNAAQVYIQYMPYGEGITRIVYAANRGTLNAATTVDVTANGGTFTCSLGTTAAMSVTSLSADIDACVQSHGIVSGKVALLLTFVAPDQAIEVYSAYNVGGSDRGTVVNTSNGRSFFYGTGVNFTSTPTP